MRGTLCQVGWARCSFHWRSSGQRAILFVTGTVRLASSDRPRTLGQKTYLGFDRNEYPGDSVLAALHQRFSFAGYWLNTPPGAKANSWSGKRDAVKKRGSAFWFSSTAASDTEIRRAASAEELGQSDAQAAVAAASREGFPHGSVIFLDQEEGGRMLPEQKSLHLRVG